jgi:peptidoglycan/LPS O-acetylase OafA/YrhL
MVVFQHLGGLGMLGGYAVFGFYILSGYLMTLIVHGTYGYSLAGFGRYAVNRFLRIYPIYWVACALSVALIVVFGAELAHALHPAIAMPDDLSALLTNLFILFEHSTSPRLTPPAWALTVELFFYVAIGLGLSRTRFTTALWLGAAALYTVIVNYRDMGLYYTYYSIPAASLPFATGALIYHYREAFIKSAQVLNGAYLPLALFSLLLLNYAISRELGVVRSYGFYVNYILNALLVVSLAGRQSIPLLSARQDRWLGDLSYPIYLIHYQAALLMLSAGVELRRGDFMFALLTLPLIVVLAWLLARGVEQPIEALRTRVKSPLATAAAPDRPHEAAARRGSGIESKAGSARKRCRNSV